MVRSILEYKRLAKHLLEDKPIFTPNKEILAYRIADEREKQASQAIYELLDVIDKMEEDLLAYCVCGTCAAFQVHSPDGKRCQVNKGCPYVSMTTSGCHKWRWRYCEGIKE